MTHFITKKRASRSQSGAPGPNPLNDSGKKPATSTTEVPAHQSRRGGVGGPSTRERANSGQSPAPNFRVRFSNRRCSWPSSATFYAREIYGSLAVEDEMRRDRAFVDLCLHEFPDARALRKFRRHNHARLYTRLPGDGAGALRLAPGLEPAGFSDEASRRLNSGHLHPTTLNLDGDGAS